MTETPDDELRRLRAEATSSITRSLENLSRSIANGMTKVQGDISDIKTTSTRIEARLESLEQFGSRKSHDNEARVEELERIVSYGRGALWVICAALAGLWALVLIFISQHKW